MRAAHFQNIHNFKFQNFKKSSFQACCTSLKWKIKVPRVIHLFKKVQQFKNGGSERVQRIPKSKCPAHQLPNACHLLKRFLKSRFQECYKVISHFKNSSSKHVAQRSQHVTKPMFQPCCKLSKHFNNSCCKCVLPLQVFFKKKSSTCAADSKRATNLNFQTRRTFSNIFCHTQQFYHWKPREVLLAK